MSLKVELKPGERIIIGTAVLRNGDGRVRFFIEGDAAILREKDILTPSTADSPAKRLYLAIQLMYLGEATAADGTLYLSLARDFLAAVPSAVGHIDRINNEVLSGQLYKALRAAKVLISYERDVIEHAFRGSERLCADRPDDAVAA